MSNNIANPLDVLESTLRNMKLEVMNMLHDPFDQGRIATYIENALATIADMKAPPARAPGKHEPEPILLAAKPARHRAQKH